MCFIFSRSFTYVHQSGLISPATISSVRTTFRSIYIYFPICRVCVVLSHLRNIDLLGLFWCVNKLFFCLFCTSSYTYIVGFEPNATMNTAHHMLLYGCGEPGSEKPVWYEHNLMFETEF